MDNVALRYKRIKRYMLKYTAFTQVGYFIPFVICTSARYLNFASFTYWDCIFTELLAVGKVCLFLVIISLRRKFTASFINTIYFMQFIGWLAINAYLISWMNEIRFINLFMCFIALIFLFTQATMAFSIAITALSSFVYLSVSYYAITYLQQSGDLYRELFHVSIFSMVAIFIALMSGMVRKQREELKKSKKEIERTQSDLLKSEEKYRTILESIKEGYYELDLKGTFTFVNDALCEMLGRTPDEMVGLGYREYMSEDMSEKAFRAFNEVFRTKKKWEIVDWEIIRSNGNILYLETSVELITDSNGTATGFRGMARDVSTRRKAEDALRESEEKYRSFLDVGVIGYFEVDLKGNFTFSNRSFQNFLGYTEEELAGLNFQKVADEKDVPRIMDDYASVYLGKTSLGITSAGMIKKDGQMVYGENYIIARKNRAGETDGFRCIGIDITDRKKAEEALRESEEKLRESEEKYRTVVDMGVIGYFEVDLAGNFTYCNDSICDFLGYPEEELIGMNFRQTLSEEDARQVLKDFGAVFQSKTEVGIVFMRIIKKDGAIVYGEGYVGTRKNRDGDIIGFRCIGIDVTDRKKAEEALRESEEKYRHFVENAGEVIYKSDWKGNFLFFNQAYQNYLGYTGEEICKMNYLDVIPPEYRDGEFAFYRNQLKNGIDESQRELPVLTKSGEVRWIEQSVKSIKDETGRIIEFDCIAHDITDRKKAEEALRTSEEKYRDFIEKLPIVVFEVNTAGEIMYINTTALNLTGYAIDEVLNMPASNFIKSDEINALEHGIERINREGKIYQHVKYHLIRKDGSYMPVHLSTSRIMDEAQGGGFQGIMVDMTDIENAQEALRESEKQYRLVVENISDCINICSYDGHFKWVSPSVERLVGYKADELIGRHFLHFVEKDHRERLRQQLLQQIENDITVQYLEFRMIKKDGSNIWAGQMTRMIKNDDGTLEFFNVARDVSDRKKAEEARQELEAQKTRFFTNVSHEIRTPLTLMLSPIESYLQGDYHREVGRDFFENLYRNGLRLLKLINNLLDFSKIEAGRMDIKVVEIDIVKFIRNYVASLQSACDSRGVILGFIPPNKISNLYADPEKIDKVFMNLLSNSLKFTEMGGTITVRVREDDVFCYIDFMDTGMGIPGGSIEKIFERFGQADSSAKIKQSGTGIGLALARELVEMHGGTISVESRYIEDYPEDHGTIFTVTLLKGKEHFEMLSNVSFNDVTELDESVADHRFVGMREMGDISESASTKDPTVNERVDGQLHVRNEEKSLVLIVDDNSDMRDFLSALMKDEYAIITAENGKEGLDIVKKRMPHLVVTDVMMPVMDGYEMTRHIKEDEKMKQTPVIMLTAKAEISQKIEGLEFGADDYLTKPFNSKELLTRIKTLLKTREYEKMIARRNHEIEQELEVARLLQQRLLPDSIPDVSGFRSHVIYIPMDKVGGDFYDVKVNDETLEFFIADVSGHGLPGAFLSMIAKMAYESIKDRVSPRSVLYVINDVICQSTVNNNYITAFYCMIDRNTSVMTYCNAGHFPPLVYRKRTKEFFTLNAKGTPLGWFTSMKLEQRELHLEEDDRILLYTDGIIECTNSELVEFGDEGFMEFIKAHTDLPPEDFSTALLRHLREFSGEEKFDDDLCLIVVDVL